MNVPSFIYKGQPKHQWPEWLHRHAIGASGANGTFMLKSKLGQMRVHSGHLLFEFDGVAYTGYPDDARSILKELQEEAAGTAHLANGAAKGNAPREESDTADLRDDTDDISARIAEMAGPAAAPQKAAPRQPAPAPVLARQDPIPPPRRVPKPKGMPPSIEMRHPSELLIDDTYQRSIDTSPSRALITKIAAGWDWRMCLPLVVSKRDEGLFVIDGQHRLAASKMRGDIPFLPCCVFKFENVAEEAAMFVAMNRSRRAINRLDDFHAAQAGGDEEALAIVAIVRSVGFTVSRKTGSASWVAGEVAFTSAIANVRRKHGDAIVRDALQMMADAFPGQRLVAGSSVFSAIARLLISPPNGTTINRERLAVGLRRFDMRGWASFLQGSKGGDERAQRLRDMLLLSYDEAVADAEKAAAA